MAKKRKTEGHPITEEEFQQSLERIAAEIGRRRARQIADTALKLIKLKVPEEAISICVNHIIELARTDSIEMPLPGTEDEERLAELQGELSRLERVPENEGVRFEIMRDIQDLEKAVANADEWPDVIGTESEVE
jgi:aminoglycoside phosphotransferase (APT) family kinase protein